MCNVDYLIVDFVFFVVLVELSDEEVQVFYDENILCFDIQEKVNLVYVILVVEDLKVDVFVSEEEIEQEYQNNIVLYKMIEECCVLYILIEFGDDKDVVKEKVELLLVEVE